MSSLCDHCFKPGACCKGFHLYEGAGNPMTFWADGGKKAVQGYLDWQQYPFRPMEVTGTWIADDTGREYQTWRFSCDALDQSTGRCTRYAERPQLCKDFAPASSPLCVHYLGAEGTGDGL